MTENMFVCSCQRLCTFLMLSILTAGCVQLTEKEKEIREGEKLAEKNCQTCHSAVDPALLTKRIWLDFVLPAMSKQFGMELWSKNGYLQTEKSTITYEDWMKIVRYYEAKAPDSLINKRVTTLAHDWSIFQLRHPEEDVSRISTTLMVAADTATHHLFSAGADSSDLVKWNHAFEKIHVTRLASPATHISFRSRNGDSDVVTCLGGMKALNSTIGEVLAVDLRQNSESDAKQMASGLIRPVHSAPIDYNKDGLTDYIVCAFGNTLGGLYVLKQSPDKSYQSIPIREVPGAIQSSVGDFNNDGWPDFMTLFAHGNEGIWLFLNDQKGGFETKNLLTFPPVYGSSSFQLVDMNRDGKLDILYSAGDNSDYSKILKPFHGVYIFTNTGNFNFRQSYFYPINGCTKAFAADFDKDGDLDIATIAFFADLKNKPAEKFIYFEKIDGATSEFQPKSIPIEKYGRWICMDVNDIDGDGDDDIILGNYSKGLINQESVKPDWNVHIPFIVLENQTIKPRNL